MLLNLLIGVQLSRVGLSTGVVGKFPNNRSSWWFGCGLVVDMWFLRNVLLTVFGTVQSSSQYPLSYTDRVSGRQLATGEASEPCATQGERSKPGGGP